MVSFLRASSKKMRRFFAYENFFKRCYSCYLFMNKVRSLFKISKHLVVLLPWCSSFAIEDYFLERHTWEIVSQNHNQSYARPDIIRTSPQGLFVLYKKPGFIVHFDATGNYFGHFGNSGLGPGEINPSIINFEVEGKALWVFHPKRRIDVFSINGELLTTEKGDFINGNDLLYKEKSLEIYQGRRGGKKTILWTVDGKVHLETELVAVDSLDRINGFLLAKQGTFLFFCSQNSELGNIHYLVFNIETGEIWDRGSFPSTAFELLKPERPKDLPSNATFFHRVLSGCTVSDELGFVLTNNTRGKLNSPEFGRYELLDIFHPGNRQWVRKKLYTTNEYELTNFQHLSNNHWIGFDEKKESIISFTVKSN